MPSPPLVNSSNKEFFEAKIKNLSNDKILELLRLNRETNNEIIMLAIAEAKVRALVIPEFTAVTDSSNQLSDADHEKLKQWNWGAFYFTVFWVLTNKLDKWMVLLVIPGVNIAAVVYLGIHGNRLAFEKSDLDSVEDFMTIQRPWNKWGRLFSWGSLVILILFLLAWLIS